MPSSPSVARRAELGTRFRQWRGNTSSRRRVPMDRESTREVGILVIRASFFRMINQTGS